MKKTITTLAATLSMGMLIGATNVMADGHGGMHAQQDPSVQADIDAFQGYFKKNFPDMGDVTKGAYAFNEDNLAQFEAVMDMPPFEDLLDKGGELWETPFKNGKTYASCFNMPVEKIRTHYPRWNAQAGKVETLEAMINKCRIDNGEKKMGYKKGAMAYISAYLTTQAEGEIINVIVPKGDKKALAAYNNGKKHYYTKRGQLNMSCADCHVYNASKRIRAEILSPGLGQLSHFPVWRGKWAKKKGDGFGTIQRRYGGCNKQVRAQPFKAQRSEYNNLEFFHTAMSNGTPITGTEYRK
jgi:sulfur-oxidizing protein SoxA